MCHPVFPLPAHGNLRELGLSVLICPSLTSIFFACFCVLHYFLWTQDAPDLFCIFPSLVLKSITSAEPSALLTMVFRSHGLDTSSAHCYSGVMTSNSYSWVSIKTCTFMSFYLSCFKVHFDMSICPQLSFHFHFYGIYFFNPLTFSLYVSSALNWVSCRQHIDGSIFLKSN